MQKITFAVMLTPDETCVIPATTIDMKSAERACTCVFMFDANEGLFVEKKSKK